VPNNERQIGFASANPNLARIDVTLVIPAVDAAIQMASATPLQLLLLRQVIDSIQAMAEQSYYYYYYYYYYYCENGPDKFHFARIFGAVPASLSRIRMRRRQWLLKEELRTRRRHSWVSS
jgi:hypothetical protein